MQCDVVPWARTRLSLLLPNTALSVDGDCGHWYRVSSRSRKWELECSCYYQAAAPLCPGRTWSQTQTMCVFALWTSAHCRPGSSGDSLKSFLTTFDRRKHPVPPCCHCYLNPLFFSMSTGKRRKVIPHPIRSLRTHPSLSARSFKLRRTIDVIGGKYSSRSLGVKVHFLILKLP